MIDGADASIHDRATSECISRQVREEEVRSPRGGAPPSSGDIAYGTALHWRIWLDIGDGWRYLYDEESFSALRKLGQMYIAIQATDWLSNLRVYVLVKQDEISWECRTMVSVTSSEEVDSELELYFRILELERLNGDATPDTPDFDVSTLRTRYS